MAEHAAPNGFGKMKKNSPVTLQAGLKDGSDADKFTFFPNMDGFSYDLEALFKTAGLAGPKIFGL